MTRFFTYLLDAVRSPREQLSRGQHFVRYSCDLAVYCYQQLERHRAEGMAAELTYRTIFALIPVVVLGLVMFRVFGGLDEVQSKVENELFSFFGVPEIPVGYLEPDEIESDDPFDARANSSVFEVEPSADETADGDIAGATTQTAGGNDTTPQPDDGGLDPSGESSSIETPEPTPAADPTNSEHSNGSAAANADDDPTPAGDSADPRGDLIPDEAAGDPESDVKIVREGVERDAETRATIRRTLSEITSKVSTLDFASMGVFGLLLFVYAAVALADSTEHLFNRIYDAPTQRPIHLRLAIHWSIITLGSGLLAMSLYMSGQVIDWVGEIGAGSTIRGILGHLVAIAASWVLLFLLYALMPNTHVSVRAAAASGLVAALLWEAAKSGFQIYVYKAVPYSALYGSIGLIPLFLFWIYVTWLIVLFGLILTYTLQTLRGSRVVRPEIDSGDTLSGDPDWMLPIMAEVARAFNDGRAIDNQDLADHLGLTSRVTMEMVSELIGAGLLRRVSVGDDDALTLARPAERIPVTQILSIAHRTRPTNAHPSWRTLADLKAAERAAAEGLLLSELLAQWPSEDQPGKSEPIT